MEKRGEVPILSYAAIGDSLTAGVGSSFFAPGFVGRYARMTEHELNSHVCPNIVARAGYTTGDVLRSLKHPYVRERLKRANIITITAGGNDLIQAGRQFARMKQEDALFEALAKCRENMSEIVHTIYEYKHEVHEPFIIRIVDLYNPLPEVALAGRWVRLFNRHIDSFSGHPHIKVAKIYDAFKRSLDEWLSPDGIHPNGKGYEHIAETLHQLGYGNLHTITE
ncbi:GDSL-type esterase/lipase family protein [Bacillus songklensis]|uniref:GDSL-type esterase/lipase family protein n=1 Tax=Bacillus songklensis TaxID=1069116 RepID=A0ABV8AZZ7_9BACI